MNPETEFRTLPVIAPEPADRTVAGVIPVAGAPIDIGTVDTTDEARDIPVRVFWWRVRAMNDAAFISNVRIWLDGAGDIPGDIDWYLDITDTWNPAKTPVEVMTGSPGALPLEEAEAAVAAPMTGDCYTGTGHDETSRYIYISGRIGINVPTGGMPSLQLRAAYDWK